MPCLRNNSAPLSYLIYLLAPAVEGPSTSGAEPERTEEDKRKRRVWKLRQVMNSFQQKLKREGKPSPEQIKEILIREHAENVRILTGAERELEEVAWVLREISPRIQ